MAMKIYDTLKPQGNYPAVKGEDVQVEAGGEKATVQELAEAAVLMWQQVSENTEKLGKTVALTAVLEDGSEVVLTLCGTQEVDTDGTA